MSKPTPGPWTLLVSEGGFPGIAAYTDLGGKVIVLCGDDQDPSGVRTGLADARLICQAPAYHEAVGRLIEAAMLGDVFGRHDAIMPVISDLRRIHAEAEGS
jgi:hypothetical protein